MTDIPERFKSINVFVSCGGKCGSQTLYQTFRQNGFSVLHTHGNVQFQSVVLKSKDFTLYDLIQYASDHHPEVYVLDVYRTPIERAISSFFHNIKQHLPKVEAKYTVTELINYFNTNKKYTLENYHPMNQILEHFNISYPPKFDFEKEYIVFKHKNITFIKLRFQSIDRWQSILTEIFNRPITIVADNLSSKLWYYSFYKNFLASYKPPTEYLEEIKDNSLFRYFNTEEEQELYLKKWKS